MASAIQIPVSEYLETTYHPDCEYIDGEVQERSWKMHRIDAMHVTGEAADIVGHAFAIAGKGDHVRYFGGGSEGDIRQHFFFQAIVILFSIPAVRNRSSSGSHGGH